LQNNPRVVFCTTCKGRTQHVVQTLPKNLADNPDARFVLLDYCDPGPLRNYLWANHRADIGSGRLTLYSYFGALDPALAETTLGNRVAPPDIPFHMAHAKNMAARCAIREGADVLVTLDADNFAGPDFAQYVAANLGERSVLCPDFSLINAMPHGPDRPARGYAGRLAIRAQDFIKLGGYDNEFDTWRGEDFDLLFRLDRSGYSRRSIDNRFLNAVRHNAAVRFAEYPHAVQYEIDSAYEIRSIAEREGTVRNSGSIGVGTVYRNFDPVPVSLPPIPTRVFGIGMHRTATTSLHHAFETLGFDSWHWRTGNDARLIWEEMNSGLGSGRSATLEKWYALCDLPIPLLYRKLDAAYPGSKFILTLRNEQAWLNSVKWLWSDRNPDRWTWDAFPVSDKLHTALYGRRDFNADVMLARYRRHNAEVREYFKGRGDLLVMDMDQGHGWPELCGFLGCTIPAQPYPSSNGSAG
jgi:hypothetical protein